MPKTPKSLEELVYQIASEVEATEAAVFGVAGSGMNPLLHVRPGAADEAKRHAALEAFKDLICLCINGGRDGAIEINNSEDAKGKQFCLVALARNEIKVLGAAAFIVRCSDMGHAQWLLSNVQRAAAGI